ncbi:MAG TPA: transglycosylase domain-containing protein, partial [Candidatus Dormibacteraeota bacterium]|nr:transglycosylase domain-containing protein [Candidatus Dormibacteraeota bacterium]
MSKQEVAIKNRRARDRALKRGINRPRESRLARGLIAAAPAPFFVFALVLGLGFIGAGTAYAYFAQDLPAAADFSKDPLPLSTKVYARDGTTLLYEFAEERREPVRYDELPQTLIDATISAEDKTFWTNPGVDISGIARAVFYDLFRRGDARPQGASTLTQQLVKLRLVGDEVSIDRKIKEALLAIEVTRTYSKKEILELYFNQIYYGSQAYGVKAAALAYFGTSDLAKLTLAQQALLAGLPQAPSQLDPTKEGNLSRALERRSYVLDQMAENGYITEDQADAARNEPIKITGRPLIDIRAPHFVFRVKDQLVQILGDESAISRGGYTIITSLDFSKQQEAEKQVKAWVDELHKHLVYNASLVTIDPKTGEVLAYVGSVDYYNTSDPRVRGQFDAAGLGERQPGSSFKV